MPKILELTVELDIQRVSCPGVWLCQDGRVCLTVFALGTSYHTCLLPPVFPLMFNDVFYFQKRFQETCALNNICCLLKNETIYCELVQWSEDYTCEQPVILAQYLGTMNDVLFPSEMCSNNGVDLLMRRSKHFPGILSPKIEVATKVRIDEVWNQVARRSPAAYPTSCNCSPRDDFVRQKQVCHTAGYHRLKCPTQRSGSGSRSRSRSRSRSGSGESRSCSSVNPKRRMPIEHPCRIPDVSSSSARCRAAVGRSRSRKCCEYCVYNVYTSPTLRKKSPWRNNEHYDPSDDDFMRYSSNDNVASEATDQRDKCSGNEARMQRLLLESRYIDNDKCSGKTYSDKLKSYSKPHIAPCVCEICKRYHELFHQGHSN